MDKDFGVFVGDSFNTSKFVEILNRNGIEWEVLPSGHIRLDDEAFEEREVYPQLLPLRYLRGILSKQRILDFPVGSDGRNRTRSILQTPAETCPSPTNLSWAPRLGCAAWSDHGKEKRLRLWIGSPKNLELLPCCPVTLT